MASLSDDYYRVYRALHLVTHEAVQCVDHCVKVWHQNQTLASCTTQCPDGRKPKSCQQCVAWAKAIEGVCYPSSNVSQVNWSNINPSNLGRSHVEVAKAFVLRLPKTTGGATQYTSMSDFDSASLLMIMARFREFHGADQASYDQIMKISGIRNDLSHVKLKANMELGQQKVKQYFKDIEDFVTCLENLHPVHFTSGHNIKAQLKEIQQEPVSKKMKEDIQLQMQHDLDTLRQETEGLQQSMTELKETTTELKKELKRVGYEMANMKEDTHGQAIGNDDFIRCWRSLDCVAIKSIPCLRSVLKQWQVRKSKNIKPCQRPRPRPPEIQDECSEGGKPVPATSCDNCVAWGEAVEDAYYLQTSKANIPWDTINPMCLDRSHFMVAKAFVSKSAKIEECTKLEDLDLGCLLDVMMRFKGFAGLNKSSHDIVRKILDMKSMLIQKHEKGNFHLTDQENKDVFSHIHSFISFLQETHPLWFTSNDADDTRTAITQIQQETITRKMWQDVDMQIKHCKDSSQIAQVKSDHREIFIKSCTAIHYTVTKSIPCLRKVLQQWHSTKGRSIQGCQRVQSASNQECKTTGKPTSASSCANCVAWSEVVEGAYYPRKSKGDMPWDIIDPTRLSDSIVMVAKAFVSNPDKVKECTKLEDLDLGSILDVMMRFKDFLGGEKNTHQTLSKISDVISMLTEMRGAQIFHLQDQQLDDIFLNIDKFVSCLETLHSEWFTSRDAADIRKALMKIKTTPFVEWINEGLPRVHEIMEAFDGSKPTRRFGNSRQNHDAILKNCREELHRYYLESLCKIPLFPGDFDSCVDLKNIYTKLSFEIKLPRPCKPVKMPLNTYAEMFERKSVEGRPYTRFLISAPAGLGKTTLTAKIAYDWVTKEEALKDFDLLFVINMRSVDHSSNLEEVILSQIFPKDTTITSEDISTLLQRYSHSTIVILDAIDESDRKLYDRQNRGSLVEFLTGKILLPCRMLATTRPWRIGQITKEQKTFAQVEINGFDKSDIREYIEKFFREDKELGKSLIRHANQNKLIDEIAYIPLMSLLICVYWREVQQDGIPHRIGQLYDAIINIMHDHYLKKQGSTGQFDDIKSLLYQMGEMALDGFWPPENRVVFSANEMSSSESVESACQIGYLTKQESRPSIIKRSSRSKATLTFFHKTFGEKCAGEYLAHLVEEESATELMGKLYQLTTAEDALSVRLILQFACGASKKAAKVILAWLMKVYYSDKSVCLDMVRRHATEQLELEETLKIQNFMDLCLRCNYEADCVAEFSLILINLFPLIFLDISDVSFEFRRIHFLAISAFTSVALGYYLSNTTSDIKWSIILRPAAHPSKQYLVDYGPLVSIMDKAKRDVNHIPVEVIRAICSEYINKHPDILYKLEFMTFIAPGEALSDIRMWQACEGLPTPDDSDVGPILDSIKNISLVGLDLNSFSIPKRNMEKLLQLFESNYLSSLQFLNVCYTGMTENQMLYLAKQLKRTPNLFELRVRQDFDILLLAKQFKFMSILAESMLSMKALHHLHIDYVPTSPDDMMQFVHKFPRFASQLRELLIRQTEGVMSNKVVSTLADHIVIAKQLEKFHIDFNIMIYQSTQNKLLSKLRYLPCLFEVQIFLLNYANDVVKTMSDVMKSLPNLGLLAFSASGGAGFRNLPIDTTTWNKFKTALLGMTKLNDLRIMHIWFKEKDFADLLAVCREKHYKQLMFSTVCVPKGFVVPDDEFLHLH